MKVVVTGSSGFVGGHVCAALADAGHDVVPQSWTAPPAGDVVVHLAAVVGGIGFRYANQWRCLRDNLQLGLGVVDRCRVTGERLVALGSVCAYPSTSSGAVHEDRLWEGYPREPYGVAKRLLLDMCKASGISYTYLVPANMYGPGDHYEPERSSVIPAIIAKVQAALDGGLDVITLGGDSVQEFLFVQDCAHAIVAAVEAQATMGPVNLGSGHSVRIAALAATICQLMGFTGEIRWDHSFPNGPLRWALDSSLARQLFNWSASTSLQDGLRQAIQDYRR